MEHAERAALHAHRAALHSRAAPAQKARALADFRPQAEAQRTMIQAVQGAPAMVAQRRSLDAAFGSAGVAQRAGAEEELQMKRPGGVAQLAAEEEELQMKRAPGVAQLAAPEEELQMKAGPNASPAAEAAPARGNSGLPDGLRAGIEALSGVSMEGVNVHYNSSQPAQLNALAYAQGRDIHLAPGQEQHLPHEAWHVAQQAQGRVQPTQQMKGGTPVNDDPGLEQEADVMGARAAQMKAAFGMER